DAVASDPAGNLIVVGHFDGTIDLGGGVLTSAGGFDVFVAKLDPAGNHLCSKRWGDGLAQFAGAVAVNASGDVFAGGHFQGTMDIGGDTLNSAGDYDG